MLSCRKGSQKRFERLGRLYRPGDQDNADLDSTGSVNDTHAFISEYNYYIPLKKQYDSQIRVW